MGAFAFATYSFVVSSLFLTLSESGVRLSLDYHSVWSPGTLPEVTDLLERHTGAEDAVLSGAVIWQLQANRPPFADLTHPLAPIAGRPWFEIRRLRGELRTSPPPAVILDGYTEQTFSVVLPELSERLDYATGGDRSRSG